ncbi:unnamed protein product, partial [Nesidiocoris tenuis]
MVFSNIVLLTFGRAGHSHVLNYISSLKRESPERLRPLSPTVVRHPAGSAGPLHRLCGARPSETRPTWLDTPADGSNRRPIRSNHRIFQTGHDLSIESLG